MQEQAIERRPMRKLANASNVAAEHACKCYCKHESQAVDTKLSACSCVCRHDLPEHKSGHHGYNFTLAWHQMLHQNKGYEKQATPLGLVLLPLLLTVMTALSAALHLAIQKLHHLGSQQQVSQHHCIT